MIQILTTDLVNTASRVFLTLAYGGGEEAAPSTKRRFHQLPPGLSMLDYMATGPGLPDCCQVIHDKAGTARTFFVRLGCDHYPNLKLKAQLVEGQQAGWLLSVDTHDSFSSTCFLPPPDHPESEAWRRIQNANIALKERIESAWEAAGIMTFNGLLRRELQSAIALTTSAK
jgi:hypothetical protein